MKIRLVVANQFKCFYLSLFSDNMNFKKLDEQVKEDVYFIYEFVDSVNSKATNIFNRYFEEKDENEKIRLAKHIHKVAKKFEKITFI